MELSDKINLVTALATAFATVGTCIVSYLTIGIAKATREAAELNRDQLDAALRPHIHVSVMPRTSKNVMDMVIRNAGPSSAMNLRLTVDKPFHFNGEEKPGSNMQDWFPSLIESFPPGTSLQYMLGTGFGILQAADLCPKQFTVTATYFHRNEPFTETTLIDLSAFQHAMVPHDPIPDELEELRKELQALRELLAQKLPLSQSKGPPAKLPSRLKVSRRRR